MIVHFVDLGLLRGITVITSNCNHTSHLYAEIPQPILAKNLCAQMIIPEANREFVATRTGREASFPISFWDGHSVTVGQFSLHGILAAHNQREYYDAGRDRFMGYIIRFGRWTIYDAGDTLLYPGLVDRLLAFSPIDLALLPINGNDPSLGAAGNLSISETISLAQQISAHWLLPMHYVLFTFNTVDVTHFAMEASRTGVHFYALDHGGGEEIWKGVVLVFTNRVNRKRMR